MLLHFLCVAVIHMACTRSMSTKFTIQGEGQYDADKWVMDIHVETVNGTATTATTASPITEQNITTPLTSIPPSYTPTPNASMTTSVSPTATAGVSTTSGFNFSSINATTAPGLSTTPMPFLATPAPGFPGLEKIALGVHNYYRSIHDSPMLSVSAKLSRDAQKYAEKVAKSELLRPEQDFVLRSTNEGENLGFRCSTTQPDAAKSIRLIMKRWYEEGCRYNFKNPSHNKYDSRHFTQMTWAGSKNIGVGVAYGQVKNLQCIYFVARYSPRGNKGNDVKYQDNVKPGVFDSAMCEQSAPYQFPVKSAPQNRFLKQEVLLRD